MLRNHRNQSKTLSSTTEGTASIDDSWPHSLNPFLWREPFFVVIQNLSIRSDAMLITGRGDLPNESRSCAVKIHRLVIVRT